MGSLATFFNLLANPPGDLIYHLVIGLALTLTCAIAASHLQREKLNIYARRTLIGGSLLLVFQIFLFVLRFIQPNFGFQDDFLYPLIERLVHSLSALWLIWLLLPAEKLRALNRISIISSVILILLFAASFLILQNYRPTNREDFNVLDISWQIIPILLALLGLFYSFFNSYPQRLVSILILLLLTLGHLLQILFRDILVTTMGAVRLAQTLALPWILVIIQRFNHIVDLVPKNDSPPQDDLAELRLDIKPLLLDLLLKINLSQTDEGKIQSIVKALSLAAVADICYVVKVPPGMGKLEVLLGYDLIRETFQKPDALARENLPTIMDAWEQCQPLILRQGHIDSQDASTLGTLIKYHPIGQCLAYPLNLSDQTLLGGIIFLSPYTGKVWGGQTLLMMDQIKDSLTQVLFLPGPLQKTNQALSQAHVQLNILADEVVNSRNTLKEIESKLNEKETDIKRLKAKYQIEKMAAVKQFDLMNKRITELSSQAAIQQKINEQISMLQTEVRQLSSDRERLSLELSRSNALVRELQTQTGQTGPIRLSLDTQIISLDSIAANIKLQLSSQLRNKQIELEIQNPDGRQMIKTDPELLQTVLFELLTNAIQASKRGSSIHFNQFISFEMGMLTFQVTDYGDGLTQAEQSALFSALHETIPGIGNVKSIRNAIRAIRVLNGKIWLKSKKESYTTFRCEIPVRIVD